MPRHVSTCLLSLETQSAFACGFRQSSYSTVIEVAAPVEYDILDALLLRALGDELADGLGGRDAGAGLEPLQRRLFQRRRRDERGAAIVIDDLRVNMFRRAKYAEPAAAMRRRWPRVAPSSKAPSSVNGVMLMTKVLGWPGAPRPAVVRANAQAL